MGIGFGGVQTEEGKVSEVVYVGRDEVCGLADGWVGDGGVLILASFLDLPFQELFQSLEIGGGEVGDLVGLDLGLFFFGGKFKIVKRILGKMIAKM